MIMEGQISDEEAERHFERIDKEKRRPKIPVEEVEKLYKRMESKSRPTEDDSSSVALPKFPAMDVMPVEVQPQYDDGQPNVDGGQHRHSRE